MQSNKYMLIGGLIVTGLIGAIKAIAPLEPAWAWLTSLVPVLIFVAGYLTVPGTPKQVVAHSDAGMPW